MKKNKTVTVFSTSDSEKGSPTGIYENYQQLALAVVGQACKDYEATLRKLYQHPRGKEKVALLLDKRELDTFFHSAWFEMLTDLDGDYLLRGVKEKAMGKEKERIHREIRKKLRGR